MTLQDMIQQISTLSVDERKQLLHALVDSFDNGVDAPQTPSFDVLDFAGIGAELYDGTDAQQYVNALRDEWDERP
jgi:hypothetical protein